MKINSNFDKMFTGFHSTLFISNCQKVKCHGGNYFPGSQFYSWPFEVLTNLNGQLTLLVFTILHEHFGTPKNVLIKNTFKRGSWAFDTQKTFKQTHFESQ